MAVRNAHGLLRQAVPLFQLSSRSIQTTGPLCQEGPNGYNFEMSTEQRDLQELSRKFTRDEIIPKAAAYDLSGEFPTDILKKAWELGLINLFVPEYAGGASLGNLDQVISAEEQAYGCTGILTAIQGSSLAGAPLLRGASEEQIKRYFGQLMDEPCVGAYCVTEPCAGSDVGGIQTKCVKKGDEYVINGSKMFITGGGVAKWYFILARSDPNPKAPAATAFTGFVCPSDLPGIKVGRKEIMMGQRCSDTRGIVFEDLVLKKEHVLTGEGAGFKLAMGAFDYTRPGVAIGAVGITHRCLDESTNYALQRIAFDQPIIKFGAISDMLSTMACGLESARLITRYAAWLNDRKKNNTYIASIAKAMAGDLANKSAADAVQVLGGNGFNCEYFAEKLLRDAKIYSIYEGTTQIQKMIVSREHQERYAQAVGGKSGD